MTGCSAHNSGGDNDAAQKRVRNWALVFGALGGVATYGTLASALAAGAVSGGVALIAVAAILVASAAGAALGFFIGSAFDWFTRLKEQNPKTITITGLAVCAGKNPWGLQPWTDGDWTVNIQVDAHSVLAPAGLTIEQVRTSASPSVSDSASSPLDLPRWSAP